MDSHFLDATVNDSSKICNALYDIELTLFMSGMDKKRNMVGSPIPGIDLQQLIDAPSLYTEIKDMITHSRRGRAEYADLPRKFENCVSVLRDEFAHTHINDIGLLQVPHHDTEKFRFT